MTVVNGVYKYEPTKQPSLDQLRSTLDKVGKNFATQLMKKENWGNEKTDWGTHPQVTTPVTTAPATSTPSTTTSVPQPQWTSSFQAATIDDIAKKYGFDYSRDYAKRQAELIKQQKQDGLNVARKNVEKNLFSEADALDRNYFQQMLQSQQNQATKGINGALAADQSLRANMSRQAALGDSYREANVQNYEIDRDLGRLAAEATAYEDELYNTRRQQGFENVMQENNFNRLRERDSRSDFESDRGYNMDLNKFNWTKDTDLRDYNRLVGRDQVADSQWKSEYDRLLGRDKRSDFESDRGYNRDVLESDRNYNEDRFRDRRDYNRGVFESDRGYNRGVLESDRGYNRGVLESDRNYNLDLGKFNWSKYVDGRSLSQRDKELSNTLQALQGNPAAQGYLEQYMQAKEGAKNTPLDSYYRNQEKILRPIPQRNPVLSPVPPALNPTLSPWELMKLIGG